MKRIRKNKNRNLPILGWTEWVALPDLGVPKIKCKVDTGARTSALHTFYVEGFEEDGNQRVRFGLHPIQDNSAKEVHCVADVVDTRDVTDSGGHVESRYVIRTPMVIGTEMWPIEITLTNRDTMRFRMLLGRTAFADNFLVDSGSVKQMGRPSSNPVPHAFVGGHYDEEE